MTNNLDEFKNKADEINKMIRELEENIKSQGDIEDLKSYKEFLESSKFDFSGMREQIDQELEKIKHAEEAQAKIDKIDKLNIESYGSDILVALRGKFKDIRSELNLLNEIMLQIRDILGGILGPEGHICLQHLREASDMTGDRLDSILNEVNEIIKDLPRCYRDEDRRIPGAVNSTNTTDVMNELKKSIRNG